MRDSAQKASGTLRSSTAVYAVVLVGALATLLYTSSSALALSQRGHEFAFSFASAGTGDGQLSSPRGVAVNETTGDVYVVDGGNERVEEFAPSGGFVRTFSTNLKKAHSIAVDNDTSASDPSSGAVYVTLGSHLDKFSAVGKLLEQNVKTKAHGELEGVAVDPAGTVWVDSAEEEFVDLSDGEPNVRLGAEPIENSEQPALRSGLAVNAEDDLYFDYEPEEAFEEEAKEEPCEHAACVTGEITTKAILHSGTESNLEPGEFINTALDLENTSDVAVDQSSGNVYVDHRTFAAEYDSSGSLVQRFGAGHLKGGAGIAVNAATQTVYVADSATGEVQVFTPEKARAPEVDELSAEKVEANSAVLAALVDPGDATTSVVFEYGTSSCETSTCSTVTAATLGEAFGDQRESVSIGDLAANTLYHYRVKASNSNPGSPVSSPERTFTTATEGATLTLPDSRAWELVSPPEKNGAGFEAISKEGGVIQASEDGQALTYIGTGPPEANPEGNRSPTFTQNFARREGSSSPQWSSQDIATPNGRGLGVSPGSEQEYEYFSSDLSHSVLEPFNYLKHEEVQLSPELTEKTIFTRDNQSCASPPSTCYTPIVSSADDTAGTEYGGTGVTGSGITFEGATPDAAHVVISSRVRLTNEGPTAPEGRELYEWTAGLPAKEQLKLVSTLPGGASLTHDSELGEADGQAFNSRHAISEDGSRIFWQTAGSLYATDMATGEVVEVNTPQAGVEAGETRAAHFQTASSDGSRLFFTDAQRLTLGSTASGEKEDLYEYNFARPAGDRLTDLTVDPRSGESADVLGVIAGVAENGDEVYFVANGVLTETSNELGATPQPGKCRGGAIQLSGATCNLYAEHYDAASGDWEEPALVGVLSSADHPDWSYSASGIKNLSVRVSPNGEYLAFMSDLSLTGYDNRDTHPESDGAKDEEVFLYDRSDGTLNCASCDPTGARPSGVFDHEDAGEGLGLLVDRPETWAGQWLAASVPGWTNYSNVKADYQSRYLSDTGRLFFDSADALEPRDTNGKEDVYEYEPAGVGDCSGSSCATLISSGTSAHESAFLDASVSGDDVFFLTAAALVPPDRDTGFDVYDARVCTAQSPCVSYGTTSSSNCASGEECKGGSPSAPSYAAPATSTAPSSGNVSKTTVLAATTRQTPKELTRAQKLARALKSCRKLKQKKRRATCERRARKKFGARKHAVKRKPATHKATRR